MYYFFHFEIGIARKQTFFSNFSVSLSICLFRRWAFHYMSEMIALFYYPDQSTIIRCSVLLSLNHATQKTNEETITTSKIKQKQRKPVLLDVQSVSINMRTKT